MVKYWAKEFARATAAIAAGTGLGLLIARLFGMM